MGEIMSLSDLASLGSFVSGLAVLASLGFLYFQMRQMTEQVRQSERNQRSLMRQARTAQMVDIYLKFSEPYASELMVRSETVDAQWEPAAIQSYLRLWGAWFRQFENNYHQFKSLTLDAASWDVDLATMRYLLSSPAVRTAWRTERLIIGGGEFRDLVDGLMAHAAPTVEHYDYARIWKKRLEEEESHTQLRRQI
jgi:hypothetical protein